MKKKLWLMLSTFVILFSSSSAGAANDIIIENECYSQDFEITAYYSPLVDQYHYRQGNYEAETRLNGKGIAGASGKEVFDGMIAAPSSYDFGTNIFLEGYGWGEVADRGGAIVSASNNDSTGLDRIDIRAGKGEEGLMRAMTIGRKVVKGVVCPQPREAIPLGFNFPSDNFLAHFFKITLYSQTLSLGDNNVRVYELNNYLSGGGYTVGAHAQFDNLTKSAVCSFQVKNIIYDQNHPQCGIFDTKTQQTFKKRVLSKRLVPKNIWERTNYSLVVEYVQNIMNKTITPIGTDVSTTPTIEKEETDVVGSSDSLPHASLARLEALDYSFTRLYVIGESAPEIRLLHIKLTLLGYYEGIIGQTYTIDTKAAIYDFQIAHDILLSYQDRPEIRGRFGPTTRRTLNDYRLVDIVTNLLARY